MKQRYSNFELLRIVAMIMIILGHCVLYTAQDVKPYLGSLDNLGWLIKAFTIVAVNCFFLLTGYFSQDERVKIGKGLKLWLKTIIYSISIYVLLLIFGFVEFDKKSAINYMFPVLTKKYWFILTYFVLVLLQPFLCKMISKTSKREHTFLILVDLLFFSIHETFIPVAKTLDDTQGYGIICACLLFIIGKWLNKYGECYIRKIKSIVWLILYMTASGMIFLSNYLIMKFDIAGGLSSRGNFYTYNSITVLVSSVCLYCFFITLDKTIKYNKLINWGGRNCVAGYLITGHPLLIGFLWTDVFKMQIYSSNVLQYSLVALVLSVASLMFCIVIDKCLECVLKIFGIYGLLDKLDQRLARICSYDNGV